MYFSCLQAFVHGVPTNKIFLYFHFEFLKIKPFGDQVKYFLKKHKILSAILPLYFIGTLNMLYLTLHCII